MSLFRFCECKGTTYLQYYQIFLHIFYALVTNSIKSNHFQGRNQRLRRKPQASRSAGNRKRRNRLGLSLTSVSDFIPTHPMSVSLRIFSSLIKLQFHSERTLRLHIIHLEVLPSTLFRIPPPIIIRQRGGKHHLPWTVIFQQYGKW